MKSGLFHGCLLSTESNTKTALSSSFLEASALPPPRRYVKSAGNNQWISVNCSGMGCCAESEMHEALAVTLFDNGWTYTTDLMFRIRNGILVADI